MIDDNVAMRRMLLKQDHTIIEAQDGSVGLARYPVIADIVIPEKKGIETIREMRQRTPDVKILAISGAVTPQNAHYLDRAEKLGADITLTKPTTASDLHAAVNSLLGAASGGSCAHSSSTMNRRSAASSAVSPRWGICGAVSN